MIITITKYTSSSSFTPDSSFTLYVQAKDSIKSIKQMISAQHQIPVEHQYISQKKILFFDETLPLSDYHLGNRQTGEVALDLTVIPASSAASIEKEYLQVRIMPWELLIPFTVTSVQFIDASSVAFSMKGKTTIRQVKEKIFAATGFSIKLQRLMYMNNIELEDDKTLAQCFVSPNSNLTLVEKGKAAPSSIMQLCVKKFITLEPNVLLYMNSEVEDGKRTCFSSGIRWPAARELVASFDLNKFHSASVSPKEWDAQHLSHKSSVYWEYGFDMSITCLEKSDEDFFGCHIDLKQKKIDQFRGIAAEESFACDHIGGMSTSATSAATSVDDVDSDEFENCGTLRVSFQPPWKQLRSGYTYQFKLVGSHDCAESVSLSFIFNVSNDNSHAASAIGATSPLAKKSRTAARLFSTAFADEEKQQGKQSQQQKPKLPDNATLESVLTMLQLQHHLPKFKEQEIDLSALKLLDQDQLKELNLPLGARAKLASFLNLQ